MVKVGDKVRCLFDEGSFPYLDKGKVYTVVRAANEPVLGNVVYLLDFGNEAYFAWRFELVKEEKWESVFQSNDVFRCGNKIKVVVNRFEGYAECNKNDKFDLMFGVNLAAHRARVKYHQWVIEKMLKEGAK